MSEAQTEWVEPRAEAQAVTGWATIAEATGGFLITDTEGRILEIDHAAAVLFHASQRRMSGKLLSDFLSKDSASSFQRILRQSLAGGRIIEWEVSTAGETGSVAPLWLIAAPMADETGKKAVLRWLARGRDGAAPGSAAAQGREELEQRVQQRTTDLLKANELLGQEIESRKRTEAALIQAREELESRVKARTAELGVANEMLKEELAERKRAEEFAAQRTRELSALHSATTALHYTLELEPLLGQILDAATSAIPAAEKGLLHLIARDTGQLEMRAFFGYTDPRIQKFSFPGSKGYVVKAVQERKPLLLDDIQSDPEVRYEGKIPEAHSIQSAIIAPLIIENEILGALALESSNRRAFNPGDLRLLVSFAVTASAAIRNAQLHAEVQKLAITDALTGVYNRRGFFELGRREIDRSHRFQRPLAAMILDFDHFKEVNDQYGHAAGDHLLRVVIQHLLSITRQIDIFGRYGGDEFCLLMPETDLFAAMETAERLRTGVAEQPVVYEETVIPVTISIGVVKATPEMLDLGALIARADAALYRAKQNGRNRVEMG